jgi:hypothetical protein
MRWALGESIFLKIPLCDRSLLLWEVQMKRRPSSRFGLGPDPAAVELSDVTHREKA